MKSQRWGIARVGIRFLMTCSLASVMSVSQAADTAAGGPLRIGVIVDMSGVYSGIGGSGGVTAVRLAVRDFGGKVLGRPVEVLSADYQNKVDVAATKVRTWYDQDNVQAVIESTDSASALALQKLGADKREI